jgi:dihydroorotase-like cyclic amidohydrolase
MGNTFGKIPSPSTGAMLEAFEVVAPTGKRISLHAETNSIMERRQERLMITGRRDPLAHIASRPAVVAVEAVSRAAILAEWTGARIHILHISSAEELRYTTNLQLLSAQLAMKSAYHCMLDLNARAQDAAINRLRHQRCERCLIAVVHRQETRWLKLAEIRDAMVFGCHSGMDERQ